MAISASQVKELRERTGAGMMECKRALEAAEGDIEQAADTMRREGLAKADKKAGRVAAEGCVVVATSADDKTALLLEVNCETDFVAKNEEFSGFAQKVAQAALDANPVDTDALAQLPLDGSSVEEKRRELIATLGENIGVRRFQRVEAGDGVLASYLHGSRIGTVVAVTGGDADLARDLAMHVAASAPQYLNADAVPADVREREKAIFMDQAKDSGKPADIIEKMVEGKLRKYLGEITLLGQPFVKDPDQTVEKLVKAAGASIVDYARLEVGEGIEKKEEDFAAEVRAQAESSAR
ncbi:MAG: elongation factor Ts [Salinisphaeraceae bacterium]|jgi:elongation factor Ts|nr:elongation factor Ts [Salinisphaeraceae bacterium]